MGADFSKLPAEHRRIYQNILNIQSPGTRAQMIQTLLSSPEHTDSARAAGVYGHLLHYVQSVKEGRAPPPLPGQGQGQGQGQGGQGHSQPVTRGQPNSQIAVHRGVGEAPVASQKGNEKAINYFSACLRILGLEEEVALTDTILKAAYKKAALRAHPDKGGSEKEFEAVTKAFAYLGEILTRIRGGRAVDGKVEAPTALASGREEAADKWKMVEPVQLNPSKLNIQSFNTMFEKTRIPDPEESGYGDWLKTDDNKKSTNFSGKFNRDVFHKAFEDESSQRPMRAQGGNALVAQELSLARGMGYVTELGRTSRDDYTVAAIETGKGQAFTDLKKAYTEYNTFTHETANVKVSTGRNLDQMATERKSAPAPLADAEMSALRDAEMALTRQEEMRKRRVAEEAIAENSYFERMKRLVIRN